MLTFMMVFLVLPLCASVPMVDEGDLAEEGARCQTLVTQEELMKKEADAQLDASYRRLVFIVATAFYQKAVAVKNMIEREAKLFDRGEQLTRARAEVSAYRQGLYRIQRYYHEAVLAKENAEQNLREFLSKQPGC